MAKAGPALARSARSRQREDEGRGQENLPGSQGGESGNIVLMWVKGQNEVCYFGENEI
jgi:hypothetical protein